MVGLLLKAAIRSTSVSGPRADCRLCVMKLGNAEVSPTHDTVVTDTSYARTLISEA